MKIGIIFFALSMFLVSCSTVQKSNDYIVGQRVNKIDHQEKPYVILVSIDGYRHDYTDRFKPKNLLKFRNQGSFATSLRPIFPSKTFPNHYSIVTGLYADSHGIVANKFFSKKLNKHYKLSDRSAVTDGRFYGGAPLWVAAEKQGMLAASYYWPGSEAAIQGVYPNYYYIYDHKKPHEKRVQQVLDWLKLEGDQRPHLITLYFPDVDDAGHHFGTESEELKQAVAKVDNSIGMLMEGIDAQPLPVNIFIVSDHGMVNVSEKRVQYLSDFLTQDEMHGLKLIGQGPQLFIYSDDKVKLNQLYKKLKFDVDGARFQVYKRSEVPEKYNYSRHPHIGDLVLMVQPPYTICPTKPCRFVQGVHGYDPQKHKSMHGIFYAKGPDIVSGKRLPMMENVHIYPAIMKILGLETTTTIDGKLEVLAPILK